MLEKEYIKGIYDKVKSGNLDFEDLSMEELRCVAKLYQEEISIVKEHLEKEKSEIEKLNNKLKNINS